MLWNRRDAHAPHHCSFLSRLARRLSGIFTRHASVQCDLSLALTSANPPSSPLKSPPWSRSRFWQWNNNNHHAVVSECVEQAGAAGRLVGGGGEPAARRGKDRWDRRVPPFLARHAVSFSWMDCSPVQSGTGEQVGVGCGGSPVLVLPRHARLRLMLVKVGCNIVGVAVWVCACVPVCACVCVHFCC